MIDSKYPIITVTGTKGKTSIVRLIDFALSSVYDQVLRVDTSGAYVDGKLIINEDESRERWGYTPTNCPGRFLALIDNPSNVAVLESTVFSATTGLGYKAHDVGIFTNVFEDHLGGTKLLKTVEDIAKNKSFVLTAIKKGGVAIYNYDDEMVVSQLHVIKSGVKRIAVTSKTSNASADIVCFISDSHLEVIENKQSKNIPFADFSWLKTDHMPSLYNFAFVIAALFVMLSHDNFDKAANRLKSFQFDPKGGRMVHARIDGGPQVILDFAHEKQSLIEIAKYARGLVGDGAKLTGVVRLAPSRTEKLIDDTARAIVPVFDRFVVYDKVDGFLRKPGTVKGFENKQEEVGRVSGLLSNSLIKYGAKSVERIIREDEAISEAVSKSDENDIIVYIVNDDSERSLRFLNEAANGKKVNVL